MLIRMTAHAADAVLTIAPPVRTPSTHERVRRPRLVRVLQDPAAAPLAVLVAPAGYGKTALLTEWAERDRRPFVWVSADDGDNDGVRLAAKVSRAVRAVRSERGAGPHVLVLDDLHRLHTRVALDGLSAIASDAGPGLTVALASRSRLALPIARLREQRLVCELGPRDLAMTRSEASSLLRRFGLDLDRETVDTLLARTEGWPAGLSLAALALGGRAGSAHGANRFGGQDRLVADYLRDEVLADLSGEQLEFVLESSVLDTLTGPACDAVLGRSGSAGALAELARSSLLLVALDSTEQRYRYHGLLAEMLRAELKRRRPDLEPELHRRAAAWHLRAGDRDRAVHHAICAGDVGDAGELVWCTVVGAIGHGQQATIDRWLGRFTDADIAAQPALALAAANCELARGRGDLAAYWTTMAASAPAPHAGAEAGIALMRAALARDGIDRMRDDAERAYALEREDSPWRGLCCLLAGTAEQIAGHPDTAVERLEEGARHAAVVAPDVHALCLTQLAVLAIDQEDWEGAAGLVTRARSPIDRHDLAGSATVALVFATSALVRAHRGRVDDAHGDLQVALRLQAMLTDFAPWYEVELRILAARAAVRLSDVNGARAALDEAGRGLRRVPGAAALEAALADAWTRYHALAGSVTGPSSVLTNAELRVLRYLPTHLSFREIGDHTYVSPNTVKTQANSVYRKLDVSCRSEAVTRAREIGLLDRT
jgi:LuxR family transcriptional regulator, maltose regulon positive regulatory protein